MNCVVHIENVMTMCGAIRIYLKCETCCKIFTWETSERIKNGRKAYSQSSHQLATAAIVNNIDYQQFASFCATAGLGHVDKKKFNDITNTCAIKVEECVSKLLHDNRKAVAEEEIRLTNIEVRRFHLMPPTDETTAESINVIAVDEDGESTDEEPLVDQRQNIEQGDVLCL
jgi:hypothetical protein